MLEIDNIIPKKIFIIPYRDRKQHKELFITYMTKILEDDASSYKIFLFTKMILDHLIEVL